MFFYVVAWCAITLILIRVINKLTCGISNSVTCLVGKTAIITGGNAGIGFEIALILASRGCRIIIADIENSEKSIEEIIKKTGNTNIVYKYLNLASFKSIRSFAEDINKTEKKLDILINNAGIGRDSNKLTEDGLNPIMHINYFGPFLLTHLLTDLLKKGAPSRIVFTSSLLAFTHNLTLETLRDGNVSSSPSINRGRILYSNSKLCTIIAANELARRLKKDGVTCNSVHPGVSRTKIYEDACGKTWSYKFIDNWNVLVSKTPWESAQTTFHVATSGDLADVTGHFFIDCRKFITPILSWNQKFCKQVFDESVKIVDLQVHECI